MSSDHRIIQADLKSCPKALKLANSDNAPLYVNRRGDSDKSLFTASVLIEQRRLGLSNSLGLIHTKEMSYRYICIIIHVHACNRIRY